MKVFIGWSGERSKALAQIFNDWLPLVLPSVEPWMSESGIAAGERWANAIDKQLDNSNFGILCITEENLQSNWVSFEAGALAREYEKSKVVPLLLNLELTDITGPLTQFQAKKADKPGICDVLRSINSSDDPHEPEERIVLRYESLWDNLASRIEQIPAQSNIKKQARPIQDVLEELVASMRSMEMRFNESLERLSVYVEQRFATIAASAVQLPPNVYLPHTNRSEEIPTTYLHRICDGSNEQISDWLSNTFKFLKRNDSPLNSELREIVRSIYLCLELPDQDREPRCEKAIMDLRKIRRSWSIPFKKSEFDLICSIDACARHLLKKKDDASAPEELCSEPIDKFTHSEQKE